MLARAGLAASSTRGVSGRERPEFHIIRSHARPSGRGGCPVGTRIEHHRYLGQYPNARPQTSQWIGY